LYPLGIAVLVPTGRRTRVLPTNPMVVVVVAVKVPLGSIAIEVAVVVVVVALQNRMRPVVEATQLH